MHSLQLDDHGNSKNLKTTLGAYPACITYHYIPVHPLISDQLEHWRKLMKSTHQPYNVRDRAQHNDRHLEGLIAVSVTDDF